MHHGSHDTALSTISWAAIGVETLLWVWMLIHWKQKSSRALHQG